MCYGYAYSERIKKLQKSFNKSFDLFLKTVLKTETSVYEVKVYEVGECYLYCINTEFTSYTSGRYLTLDLLFKNLRVFASLLKGNLEGGL